MKRFSLVAVLLIFCCFAANAQTQNNPTEGPVWRVSLYKVKPGRLSDVLAHWRRNFRAINDEMKRQGVIVDYRVYANTTTDGPDDWDVATAIAYKNWAALDGLGEKADAITLKHYGSREKREQAIEELNQMRQLISSRLMTELTLTPLQ
ncbi:MAG: hypothetical protein QOJ64_2006 [Acidobacteriota bacterium]|jgi:hypothetical protein|nr:hypothetical protein [Acidobacteriota bacterium]